MANTAYPYLQVSNLNVGWCDEHMMHHRAVYDAVLLCDDGVLLVSEGIAFCHESEPNDDECEGDDG